MVRLLPFGAYPSGAYMRNPGSRSEATNGMVFFAPRRMPMLIARLSRTGWVAMCVALAAAWAAGDTLTFDNADALQGLTLSGNVRVDMTKDRGGARGLAAPNGPRGSAAPPPRARRQGGLAAPPAGRHRQAGTLGLGRRRRGLQPQETCSRHMWGLLQADGHTLTVGAIYAPYLAGGTTYATAAFNPARSNSPGRKSSTWASSGRRAGTSGRSISSGPGDATAVRRQGGQVQLEPVAAQRLYSVVLFATPPTPSKCCGWTT